MSLNPTRRRFLVNTAAAGLGLVPLARGQSQEPAQPEKKPLFKISLAQWSLHRMFFGADPGASMGWKEFNRILHSRDYRKVLAGSIDPLDFATVARRDFGIDAIEWTNLFCFDRGKDQDYLKEMKRRADTEGVRILLIMCDAEGNMGDPDKVARSQTVANHHKWVEAAHLLGCHSIRVNARSDSSLPPEEQQKLAADGLRQLCEFSDRFGINVLVENHEGLSSDGKWLAGVMKMVEHPRVGTLPDFGNFQINSERAYVKTWQDLREAETEGRADRVALYTAMLASM